MENKDYLDALLDVQRKSSSQKFTKEKSQIYADGIAEIKNSKY